MSVHSIYMLKPELVDPRFDGLVFRKGTKSVHSTNENPFSDFRVENSMMINWKPRHLHTVWTVQPVEGNVAPFNDYPCLELAIPAFSCRAVQALEPLLLENGELLELNSKSGAYFAFNCITKADVLNLKKSVLSRSSPEKRSDDIQFYDFFKTRLQGLTVFRIPESPNTYFVTNTFKDRVEEAGLNGFNFIKVWPLPKDSDWRMEEAMRCKQRKKIKLIGEALVLRFRLKKEQPSPSEKKNAKEIETSLRTMLKVNTIEDKYLGSVELADFEDGDFRVVCTCPKCEELAEYLADWFHQIPWDGEVAIVKRYGNLYDKKAKEKRMAIKISS